MINDEDLRVKAYLDELLKTYGKSVGAAEEDNEESLTVEEFTFNSFIGI